MEKEQGGSAGLGGDVPAVQPHPVQVGNFNLPPGQASVARGGDQLAPGHSGQVNQALLEEEEQQAETYVDQGGGREQGQQDAHGRLAP